MEHFSVISSLARLSYRKSEDLVLLRDPCDQCVLPEPTVDSETSVCGPSFHTMLTP